MIHEVDGAFVISSRGMWLPGNYATRDAAHRAFRLSNQELQRLQETVNYPPPEGEGRPITFDDLRRVIADRAALSGGCLR